MGVQKIPTAAVMFGATALALTGCQAYEAAQSAAGIYEGYRTYEMASDVRDAEPVFDGVERVAVDSDLLEHDGEDEQAIEAAFDENFAWAVEQTLEAADLDTEVTTAEQADNPDLVVQFRQEGHDGFVERWTMGDRLLGDLYFHSMPAGAIEDEAEMTAASDHEGLFETIQGTVATRALATRAQQLEAKEEAGEIDAETHENRMQNYVDAVNDIDWIKPEHEPKLAGD